MFHRTCRDLPVGRREPATDWSGFDNAGTLRLALTLAAYALAMTIGRGSFGPLNMALLAAAVFGVGLFVLAEARAASPLIRLPMFRDPVLSASLATSGSSQLGRASCRGRVCLYV